jgi:hypothetical protein
MYRINKIKNKHLLKNNLGEVIKIINLKKNLEKIKEIYLTSVKKNKIKGWNIHIKNTIKLFLIYGRVKMYFCGKNYKIKIETISYNQKKIIVIKPKTKFAFKGIDKCNIFLSMSTGVYDKNEIIKIKFNR